MSDLTRRDHGPRTSIMPAARPDRNRRASDPNTSLAPVTPRTTLAPRRSQVIPRSYGGEACPLLAPVAPRFPAFVAKPWQWQRAPRSRRRAPAFVAEVEPIKPVVDESSAHDQGR